MSSSQAFMLAWHEPKDSPWVNWTFIQWKLKGSLRCSSSCRCAETFGVGELLVFQKVVLQLRNGCKARVRVPDKLLALSRNFILLWTGLPHLWTAEIEDFSRLANEMQIKSDVDVFIMLDDVMEYLKSSRNLHVYSSMRNNILEFVGESEFAWNLFHFLSKYLPTLSQILLKWSLLKLSLPFVIKFTEKQIMVWPGQVSSWKVGFAVKYEKSAGLARQSLTQILAKLC